MDRIFGVQNAGLEASGRLKTLEEAEDRGKTINLRTAKRGLAFVLALVFILIGRLVLLQIINGGDYKAIAARNSLGFVTLPSNRGLILDRNGEVLAYNRANFQLVLAQDPIYLAEEERGYIVSQIVELFPSATGSLDETLESYRYSPVLEYIPRQEAITAMPLINEAYLQLEAASSRAYITNEIPSLSHILGYTGKLSSEDTKNYPDYRLIDHLGKTGIESYYESELRGDFGYIHYEVNAAGQILRIVEEKQPIHGEDLILTINSNLQRKIEYIVESNLQTSPASKVSVIVSESETGNINSLISWPAYDANKFIGGISQSEYTSLVENEDNPLFSRATAGEFPSGSTIKPLYAAAALTEGTVTPLTSFQSTGGLAVGPWFFPDWRAGGHGATNLYHAIADSVNTYFYIIGGGYNNFKGLGIDTLMAYAGKFGLGQKTGIDLPIEADGFLPSPEWKEEAKGESWYIGDTYNVSIGQGDLLVTPLQINQVTSVFANGGYLVSPKLLLRKDIEKERVIDTDVANTVKDAMRRTVTAGTAKIMQGLKYSAAGKTGTAQWSNNKRNHSWFTGFLPYEQPEFVITVLVEEDGDRGLAVTISRDIMQLLIDENLIGSTLVE